MQADAIRVIGWVDDPDTYPIQPKAAHARVPARGRAPAAAHQRDRRIDARAAYDREVDPRFLRPARLLLGQHADHHVVRCRRGRRAVPRLDARSREPAAHGGRQGRFRAGLLRARGVPHRVRAAQRRGLLPRAVEGLHVRADVPRRELEHEPPPGRVLDDRARDRIRRSSPTTPTSPRLWSSTSSRPCSPSAATTWRSSRSASRRA